MTKTKQRIIEAYERGYRVTDCGKLIGPRGEIKLGLAKSQRYPTFSTNWGKCVYGLPAHQFAAYCFYGDIYIDGKEIVRHLDANTLNISRDNIKLGTYSENEYDKPESQRKNSTKLARAAQKFTPPSSKLTDEQVREIRKIYANRKGKKFANGVVEAMVKKYGVSRTVLHNVQQRKYYPNVC